jgi:hypothetical protein
LISAYPISYSTLDRLPIPFLGEWGAGKRDINVIIGAVNNTAGSLGMKKLLVILSALLCVALPIDAKKKSKKAKEAAPTAKEMAMPVMDDQMVAMTVLITYGISEGIKAVMEVLQPVLEGKKKLEDICLPGMGGASLKECTTPHMLKKQMEDMMPEIQKMAEEMCMQEMSNATPAAPSKKK